MGVLGLTTLLQKEGWLPSSKPGTTKPSLWRDPAVFATPVANHIVPIPPRSTLHMDGNGLAFYLYQVAYARLVQQVTGKALPSPAIIRSLTPSQVTQLIPTFLPLTLLEEVTKEFVVALLSKQMLLKVYWDGPGRRFKSLTDKKRLERRILEWHALQQYCLNGALPSAEIGEWEPNFPKHSLFSSQVRHTLRSMIAAAADIITCAEEADPEMARRAIEGHANHYVVGRDSDFLLMGCPYIPLDTLDAASGSLVTACVISRQQLADHFSFADEYNMIELAILMGNDYIDRQIMPMNVPKSTDFEEMIDYIRDQGAGYRVTSISEDVEEAMRFVRALYNLEDLSEFPLDKTRVVEEDGIDVDDGGGDRPVLAPGPRPIMPADLPRSLLKLQPLDPSVTHAVVRCLQAYIDQSEETSHMIQQEHLDAFLKLKEPLVVAKGQVKRPDRWDDVVACNIIERCVLYALKSAPDSRLVLLSSPAKLFDSIRFFSFLQEIRPSTSPSGTTPRVATDSMLQDQPLPLKRSRSPPPRVVLPIDEHEQKILDEIKNNRVTIIHGQTGCGKSSRLPCMILNAPPPDPTLRQNKFYISQPRRIAAKALVERIRSCEPELSDLIALRMGHGVVEYESDKTRAWFVTTGYLVRVLANQPDKFRDHSHLIIDEVHERSVDTDILCLLCRRLLHSNPRIRLILMSATLAASLYQQYFKVERPVIEVGARRFPIQQVFVEDLQNMYTLKPRELKAVHAIAAECERVKCKAPPNQNHMENCFRLATHLTMVVGRPGSAVLIFVPGMNEIVAITDLVEKLYVSGVRYTCVPIHSDIPFEDQMVAFDKPDPDEVKVIIATNSAESSVTLPDVDHVICFGLCKQIEYNESSHRQILLPCWISRSSATQRAGRTGRLRPGFVYRLYTRHTYEHYMGEFEPGEMVRIPLDSVILSLKEMLKEEAKPVLLDCLEPPDISTIERSFQSLYDSNFISEPDDQGDITMLGSFVNAMGIDLTLGSLIGYGIQMGVGPEAIEMAAVLSFPKQPWVMTNPLIHGAADYNDITSKSYISKCHFDANSYSEPLAIMNLMWDFEEAEDKFKWCRFYCVSMPRIRRLVSTRNSVRSRVAEFVGIDSANVLLEAPPRRMAAAKLTILRTLQVWLFWDTILEYSPLKALPATEDLFNITVSGKGLEAAHFEQVLDKEKHQFRLRNEREIVQKGTFTSGGDRLDVERFVPEFEQRFLSFAMEKEYDLVWLQTDDQVYVYVRDRLSHSAAFRSLRARELTADVESWTLWAKPNKGGARGIRERASGQWRFQLTNEGERSEVDSPSWIKFDAFADKELMFALKNHTKKNPALVRSLLCQVWTKKQKRRDNDTLSVTIVSHGDCSRVNNQDMIDLLGATKLDVKPDKSTNESQVLSFPMGCTSSLQYMGKTKRSEGTESSDEDCSQLLFDNAPQGARLLIVLMSGRRKEYFIAFSPLESDGQISLESDAVPVIADLPRDLKMIGRWKRMGTDKAVFINENSVPASVIPLFQEKTPLYCCCANSLEVRGGGLRAEGLTLLPPGKMFLLLSLVTFDLFPLHSTTLHEKNKIVYEGMSWENQGKDKSSLTEELMRDKILRLEKAVDFHNSCSNLGDELLCYPDKVRSLCEIFDGLDGFESKPWDSLDDNPFTYHNMELLRYEKRRSSSTPSRTAIPPMYESADARAATPVTPNERSLNTDTTQPKSWSFKKKASFSATNDESTQPNVLNRLLASSNTSADLTNVTSQTPDKVNGTVKAGNKSSKKKKKKKGTPLTNGNRQPNSADSTETMPTQPLTFAPTDSENIAPPTPQIDSTPSNKQQPVSNSKKQKQQHFTLEEKEFSTKELKLYRNLFAVDLANGETVGEQDLPSTNLLAILVQMYCDARLERISNPEDRRYIEQHRVVTLDTSHWKIYTVKKTPNAKTWYYAEFSNNVLPSIPGRGKKNMPNWMKKGHPRPKSSDDVMACLPPTFPNRPKGKVIPTRLGEEERNVNVVAFGTADIALRVEAAFWLERQFRTAQKHWYEQSLEEMASALIATSGGIRKSD